MNEGYTNKAVAVKLKGAAQVLRDHPFLYEQGEWRRLCCMVRVPAHRTFVRFPRGQGIDSEDKWIDLAMARLRMQGRTLEEIAVWLEHISSDDIALL